MKFCSGHIHDLSAALRRKGLGALVRPERAQEFAHRWLHGVATREEFDPMVVAMLEIGKKAVEISGHPLAADECPVCRAARTLRRVDVPPAWIDNVTDLMLLTAKTNALVA